LVFVTAAAGFEHTQGSKHCHLELGWILFAAAAAAAVATAAAAIEHT
jgi:hypothetical protein